jgi:hypothetical protein
MKKYFKYVTLFVAIVAAAWVIISCKRTHIDQVGPLVNTNIYLTDQFAASLDVADFYTPNSTTSKVTFQTHFNQPVHWRITITGENSYAIKTIEGTSANVDASNAIWDGSQDSLQYFRSGERCFISISNVTDIDKNYVTDQLSTRGQVVPLPSVIGRDTVTIVDRTGTGGFKLAKPAVGVDVLSSSLAKLNVGFDDENYQSFPWTEADTNYMKKSAGKFLHYYTTYPSLIPNSRGNVGIRGNGFHLLKGLDQTEPCISSPNYYIGRLESNSIRGNTYFSNVISKAQADSVYINVYVYGNGDLTQINVIVKEDDGSSKAGSPPDGIYQDQWDEQYQAIIKVDFVGWKLFSFNYSNKDFTWNQPVYPPGPSDAEYDPTDPCKISNGGKHANTKMEPSHMYNVQFSLVAKSSGGPGIAIIDYPTITLGKPKY